MKQRKKLPYLALFIDDWLASAKVRKCSETTRGVYIDLLCIMHKEKRRGCYALHDQELKPNNTRSKTQLALAKPTETQRLSYFAEFLVKRTGSAKSVILKALQELYHREILVVEDDALIQPRMYRDAGYNLSTDMTAIADADGASLPEGLPSGGEDFNDCSGENNDDEKRNVKRSLKTPKKDPEKSRARASRERAHVHNGSESGNNNIDNSNIEGENEKPTFDDFWNAYDKKRDRTASEELWGKLNQKDREAIMAYIPLYKEAQPTKRFRKDPTTFLRHRSWEDELIRENEPAKTARAAPKRAEQAPKEGDPVPAKNGRKYKKW